MKDLVLAVQSTMPNSYSSQGDMYTKGRICAKVHNCPNIYPTRTMYKKVVNQVCKSSNDLLVSKMKANNTKPMQRRKFLRNHDDMKESRASAKGLNDLPIEVVEASNCLSITQIRTGNSNDGKKAFKSEEHFTGWIKSVCDNSNIAVINIHPQLRPDSQMINEHYIMKSRTNGEAKISFRNNSDSIAAMEILKTYNASHGIRVWSCLSRLNVQISSTSEARDEIQILINGADPECITTLIDHFESSEGISMQSDCIPLDFALWIDKGAGKTAARIRMIDPNGFVFKKKKSEIVTLAEYCGSESKIDEMIGKKLMQQLNQIVTTNFVHCSGIVFKVNLKYLLFDHSMGYTFYGIKAVKFSFVYLFKVP